MAEAVGLVVGFIGLARLFSTCVDCFKLVQISASHSDEYEIFQTMLDNQQFHFMAWGRACGFMDHDRVASRYLHSPSMAQFIVQSDSRCRFVDSAFSERNRRVEETMERIQTLLPNGNDLKEKYGLKVQRAPAGARLIETSLSSAFFKAFQTTKFLEHQPSTEISNVRHNSLGCTDRNKFDKLIQTFRDLLSDLKRFTDEVGVGEFQRMVIEYELEMINDELSLEAIAAASACDGDDEDLVSHAASRRLSRMKTQSLANQSLKFDDSVSVASLRRYTPSGSTFPEENDVDSMDQEIGITKVPFSQWRKIKPRVGIVPWRKTLIVATALIPAFSDASDDQSHFSRVKSLGSVDQSLPPEKAVRLAINSQVLIGVLKKITLCDFSLKQNVLVYPFKPLLNYDRALRGYLVRMHEELQRLSDAKDKADHLENAENPRPMKAGLRIPHSKLR